MTLVREGYEAAFEEIVRRYGRPLARYAAAIVGGRSEDVTQDAFSKALLALRRNEAEIELRPWLFRIVRNTALNDLRDRPPSPEVLAEAIAGGRDPAEELERREELADLMARLRALPEPQRAAIVMRELEGLGHDEIAAALGSERRRRPPGDLPSAAGAAGRARDAVPLPLLKAMLAGGARGRSRRRGAGGGAPPAPGVALKARAATVLSRARSAPASRSRGAARRQRRRGRRRASTTRPAPPSQPAGATESSGMAAPAANTATRSGTPRPANAEQGQKGDGDGDDPSGGARGLPPRRRRITLGRLAAR